MEQDIKQVYVSESVKFFKDRLKSKYNLTDYYDPNKPVLIFGLYRDEDYNFAINHKPHKVILWCGSDSMNLQQRVHNISATHIAKSKFISDDLTNANIKHLNIPITTTKIDLIPCDRGDNIYIYYGNDASRNFYGMNFIDEIISRTKLNVISCAHDSYSYKELIEIYKKCFIGLRLTNHDGLPNTVCELGLMGRMCVHNGNQPNCIPYKNIDDVISIINNEYENRHKDNLYISNKMREFLDVGTDWLKIPNKL